MRRDPYSHRGVPLLIVVPKKPLLVGVLKSHTICLWFGIPAWKYQKVGIKICYYWSIRRWLALDTNCFTLFMMPAIKMSTFPWCPLLPMAAMRSKTASLVAIQPEYEVKIPNSFGGNSRKAAYLILLLFSRLWWDARVVIALVYINPMSDRLRFSLPQPNECCRMMRQSCLICIGPSHCFPIAFPLDLPIAVISFACFTAFPLLRMGSMWTFTPRTMQRLAS